MSVSLFALFYLVKHYRHYRRCTPYLGRGGRDRLKQIGAMPTVSPFSKDFDGAWVCHDYDVRSLVHRFPKAVATQLDPTSIRLLSAHSGLLVPAQNEKRQRKGSFLHSRRRMQPTRRFHSQECLLTKNLRSHFSVFFFFFEAWWVVWAQCFEPRFGASYFYSHNCDNFLAQVRLGPGRFAKWLAW